MGTRRATRERGAGRPFLGGFTANYDGNPDIYVIDASGGPVTRVTHHPGSERMLDWYADGKTLLLASGMQSGSYRFMQLYKVSARGGLPEKLPIPYAEMASISRDGQWVAYTPTYRQGTWKRYRGGTAPDIWLFNLRTLESRHVIDDPATDDTPMWHGQTLYFLSDRGSAQHFNVWAYSMDTKSVRQVTRFTDQDVHSASIGPTDMVFEAGGRIHLLNLESEEHHSVEISVVTDLAGLKPQIKNVSKLIQGSSISPSGKRVVFAARGELFSVPAEHGPIYNLTQSSGVAEREPAWSPDGKQIAYWTDRSGEYELAMRPAEARGEETVITRFGPGFRYKLFWSPDSRKLAFIDNKMMLQIATVADKSIVLVDELEWLMHGDLESYETGWSPDSRWLAYSRLKENSNQTVWLFDTQSGQKHQVTSGFYSDHRPVFDPDGKYLYLLTDREMSPIFGALDENMWVYANATRLAAIALRTDVPSPLAPRNDTEADDADKKKEKDKKDDSKKDASDQPAQDESKKKEADSSKDDAAKDKDKKKEPSPVAIDLENIERRLVVLPPDAGNYSHLRAISGKILYLRRPDSGSSQKKSRLSYFDFKERKEETVLEDLNSFQVTADGKKLLVARNDQFAILEPKKDQKFEKPLATDKLEMTVDPASEWRQMFSDAWRLNRDFFYDPYLHGLDWSALREQYGRLLQDAVTRWDVNFIIGELIGELNASHTYRGGGDTEPSRSRGVGMLGVDWALDNGAYRIGSILRGAAWDHARSPLDAPGLKVKAGDYILAVNRQPLDPNQDPWSAFQGLEKQTVTLTVNDKPNFDGAREILVETLSLGEEARLRQSAWVEANRRRVEQASNGRIGYIYMPDTSTDGQNNLMRQFKAQWPLAGLIIDERFNSGGRLADRFLELLGRRSFGYLAWRNGQDQQLPPVAHFGPQVMLINGWAGSGGDAFPWYFHTAKRGPLIGTRTWGGLIGPAMGHRLIDGGVVVVPPCRLYGPEGKWFAEGHGVDPDILVPEDPGAMARGMDVQLERAIQEIEKQLLEKGSPQRPGRPEYEKR